MINLRGQRGFTLVETLLAIGIAAVITGTLATAAFQIFDKSARGQTVLRALQDIQNAGRWIYRDGERAATTDLVDAAPPVDSMSLSWTDDGQPHTATYSLSGTELIRDHNSTLTTVARYISAADFSISNRLITVDLTSTPDGSGVSKPITYSVWLRPAN